MEAMMLFSVEDGHTAQTAHVQVEMGEYGIDLFSLLPLVLLHHGYEFVVAVVVGHPNTTNANPAMAKMKTAHAA